MYFILVKKNPPEPVCISELYLLLLVSLRSLRNKLSLTFFKIPKYPFDIQPRYQAGCWISGKSWILNLSSYRIPEASLRTEFHILPDIFLAGYLIHIYSAIRMISPRLRFIWRMFPPSSSVPFVRGLFR